MEDQAARLRQMVEGKTEYTAEPAFSEGMPASSPQDAAASKGAARVIAVTSGKGGVGKTNLTVNLAIALGMAGKRVIIIDADLGMANVDVILGTVSKHNLTHLLKDDVSLQDVLVHGPYGVNYISGGSGIENAMDWSPQERNRLLNKLAECEALADVILVDTGAGIGKNVLDFILSADEVILLTTPEPTALTDAYAVMKAYSLYAAQKTMKLVVNRVYNETESRDVVTKLKRTSAKFLQMQVDCLGYIYEDRNMMQAVRRQMPLLAAYPNTISARCVQAIANSLLYGGQTRVKRGWMGFLQRFIDFSG